VEVVSIGVTRQGRAQSEAASYPAMAPLNQYLIADEDSEIALARSAAPRSISNSRNLNALCNRNQFGRNAHRY
jgi:hypothetical protein